MRLHARRCCCIYAIGKAAVLFANLQQPRHVTVYGMAAALNLNLCSITSLPHVSTQPRDAQRTAQSLSADIFNTVRSNMTSAGIGKTNANIAGVSVGTVHTLPQRVRSVNLTVCKVVTTFRFLCFLLLSRYVLLDFWFAMTGLEAPPTTEYWLELP